MNETGNLVEGNSRQTWYECSLCSTHQTVIRPCPDPFTLARDLNDEFQVASAHWPRMIKA